MTRAAYRLLAQALLLAPAAVSTSDRSSARAAEVLRERGLLTADGRPANAEAWAAMPREHLAAIASADSVAMARAVLALYGIFDDFSRKTAVSAGGSAKNAGNSPENGGNPPQNGRRISRSASTSDTAVVIPFAKRKENNNKVDGPESALLNLGVAPLVAKSLAMQFSEARITEVISASMSRPRENRAGWVRMALIDKWALSPVRAPNAVRKQSEKPEPLAEWPSWRSVVRGMPDVIQSLRAICVGDVLHIIAPNSYVARIVERQHIESLRQLVASESSGMTITVLTEAQYA